MANTSIVESGRDPVTGQWRKGHSGCYGAHKTKVMKLRQVLYKSVTAKDMRIICKKLIENAKEGDLPSIRELLDRLFGKPTQEIISQNINANLTLPNTSDIILELDSSVVGVPIAYKSDTTVGTEDDSK